MDTVLVDTVHILQIDTVSNTKIYYHETIKLIENSDWISTSGAFLIALIALIISLIFSWLGYRQTKRSYELNIETIEKNDALEEKRNTPVIDFTFDHDEIKYEITNNGSGIAYKLYVIYKYKEEVDYNLKSLILTTHKEKEYESLFNPDKPGKVTIAKGITLKDGKSEVLFQLETNDQEALLKVLKEIIIEFHYEDIYEKEKIMESYIPIITD